MSNMYPTSICPVCGRLVENVPPDADPRDFCQNCSKFKPAAPAVAKPPQPVAKMVSSEPLVPPKPTIKDAVRIAMVIECKVRCPACNQKIEFDVSMLGAQIRCPKCNQKIESKI